MIHFKLQLKKFNFPFHFNCFILHILNFNCFIYLIKNSYNCLNQNYCFHQKIFYCQIMNLRKYFSLKAANLNFKFFPNIYYLINLFNFLILFAFLLNFLLVYLNLHYFKVLYLNFLTLIKNFINFKNIYLIILNFQI